MKITWSDSPRPHGLPGALQQHPAYGAALRLMGREVLSAHITAEGTPIASVQLILRRLGPLASLALLSRGPLWHGTPTPQTRADALQLIAKTLPAPGLRCLLTNADSAADTPALRQRGDLPLITPQHVAELDLTLPTAARRAAQAVKWRNRLGAAESSALRVTRSTFPADPSHWLLRAEAAQRRARGYRALPDAFTLAFTRAKPQAAQLFTAHLDGAPVAAMLFLLHAPTATYHIGWSGPAGRAASAHNLLLWQAGAWLADAGYSRLDLGTVDTETAPGLARFKIGSGASIRALGASWLHTRATAALARGLVNRPAPPISLQTPANSARRS